MKFKLFSGVVAMAALSTPMFAQWTVFDPSTMAQVVQVLRQARQAYQLEQQINSFVHNPGSWRYMLQNSAMQMGQMAGIPPDLLNTANVVILNHSRQSAIEALNQAAGMGYVTNENATLGSLLGIQTAQVSVEQRKIQAQIDSDTQITTYLSRGTGIGPQASKISSWEVK